MSAGDAVSLREAEPKKEKQLQRNLSPLNVWALAFGCTIGWAAFVMPGTAFLKRAGPLGSMIAIEVGMVVMLILSYSYHYMLQRFPVSGGEYVYASRAFGRELGFVCAWYLSLCYLCVVPLNATALGLAGRVLLGKYLQFGFHYAVAGYDVYMGELLLAVTPMLLFAFIGDLKVHVMANIQTVLAILLLGGVLVLILAVTFHPGEVVSGLSPLFQPGENLFVQTIAVAVTAPQLFVGFDTTPQFAEESKFSLDRSKVIMDTCIFCGAFVYIALLLLAAIAPQEYPNWHGYIEDLPNKQGIESIPTLYTAYRLLGNAGTWVWTIAAVSAMLTGIIGFYVATSRLLYSLARDRMLPNWFAQLNRNSAPFHASLFCMALSVAAPFFGRTLLNWAFDMASFGGTLSFACTCLAARKYALQDGRKDIAVFGTLGFFFSAALAFFLLVPLPALGCSISAESSICLILWSALGAAFFFRNRRRIRS